MRIEVRYAMDIRRSAVGERADALGKFFDGRHLRAIHQDWHNGNALLERCRDFEENPILLLRPPSSDAGHPRQHVSSEEANGDADDVLDVFQPLERVGRENGLMIPQTN